jgi:N-acyl-D-aspartate/D-glutamate deacylase
VGTVCDASYATFALMHWTRDRAEGRLSIERLVQMLACDTARYIGLRDRGTVEVGMRADLNVIDHGRLALHRPRMAADLPAGGRRLLQEASGYRATIVNGVTVLEHDALTHARPGAFVRMGRSTG